MDIGAIFPQTELSADPGAIREFVQAVEDMGYANLFVADHVLGADPQFHHHPSLASYSHQSVVHESLTLLGYMAAITTRITLATGILILPQRQTALVAKQAAEIDVLSGGRLRLGVGVGWNQVEYEALGQDFHSRGNRIEEQVALLRLLWTQPVVDFEGKWERVPEAGINPLPVQRPIPIWIGGTADVVLRRTARIGDGWFPMMPPNEAARIMIERLRRYAEEAGRDTSSIGIEARF